MLRKENVSLFGKVKDLETHLLLTSAKLDRGFELKLMIFSTLKKSSFEKTSLGFDKNNTASYAFTTSSCFVPQFVKIANPEVKEPKVEKVVKMITKSKPVVTSNPKMNDNPENLQFCHHCSAFRHTCPNFFKLHVEKVAKKEQVTKVNSQNPMPLLGELAKVFESSDLC